MLGQDVRKQFANMHGSVDIEVDVSEIYIFWKKIFEKRSRRRVKGRKVTSVSQGWKLDKCREVPRWGLREKRELFSAFFLPAKTVKNSISESWLDELQWRWGRSENSQEKHNSQPGFKNKVNRCLARYSPRATTTSQPTNRAPNEPAMDKNINFGLNLVVFGQKILFLLEKSKVLLPT